MTSSIEVTAPLSSVEQAAALMRFDVPYEDANAAAALSGVELVEHLGAGVGTAAGGAMDRLALESAVTRIAARLGEVSADSDGWTRACALTGLARIAHLFGARIVPEEEA